MSLLHAVFKGALIGVEFAETPEGLSQIQRADCAAAMWRRQPAPSFQDWLDGLEPEQLPKARIILRPEAVRRALTEVCDARGTPEGPERERLIDDAAAMADIFAGLTGAPYLRLRFDVVTTNACRRFHVDAVTVRLVCTYRGTGTQYGIGGKGGDPQRIYTVPTGSPILLRGTLWPEKPASGLLHRSPPIEGTGETRLVLVLDPVTDPDEDY